MKKDKEMYILYGILFIVLIALGFNIYLFFDFKISNNQQTDIHNMMGPKLSMMSLTEFDKVKARQMMDKDNDGKCDACGMPVEMCIDSGEMECGMNPNAKIGKLGSQHIHADWKIYLDGKQFDFSFYGDRHERQMHGDKSIKDTSAFIHIHPAQAPEKAGDVLHIHATGVPLSLFFESLGMQLTNDCLIISEKEKYCNTTDKKLRMFVNEKENNQFLDYVFSDLDKILITYADGNVEAQLNSITNFADNH